VHGTQGEVPCDERRRQTEAKPSLVAAYSFVTMAVAAAFRGRRQSWGNGEEGEWMRWGPVTIEEM
jgi:hypothetical protein